MEPNVDTAGSTINTADINVWYKCFHVLPKKVKALYNLEAVEGLSIKNVPADGTPKYKCEAFIITRALDLEYRKLEITNLLLTNPSIKSRDTLK